LQKGTETSEPIISVDLYPTFLTVAEAPAPAKLCFGRREYFTGVEERRESAPGARSALIGISGLSRGGSNAWRTTPAGAIRAGDWKLIEFFEDQRIELYQSQRGCRGTHDLAKSQPQRAAALHEKLEAWRKEMKAPMPGANKPQDVSAGGGKKKKKGRKKAGEDDE